MRVFLDTDVLVDCLRGTPAARQWLTGASTDSFQVPGVVAMELIVGCQNQVDLQRVERFLSLFEIAWPEPAEFARAHELLSMHWLSARLSIPDCLVAALALSRSARLYSFNLRHFRVVEGLDVQQPYAR